MVSSFSCHTRACVVKLNSLPVTDVAEAIASAMWSCADVDPIFSNCIDLQACQERRSPLMILGSPITSLKMWPEQRIFCNRGNFLTIMLRKGPSLPHHSILSYAKERHQGCLVCMYQLDLVDIRIQWQRRTSWHALPYESRLHFQH